MSRSPAKMTRRFVRTGAVLAAFALATDATQAAILPAPFVFTFFTPFLNQLFLLPFTLAGCNTTTT